MTLQQLQAEYATISKQLSEHFPLADKDHRVFARTVKVLEELGELADEILSSMNLQRTSKVERYTREHLEDELADTMGSLVLLAHELDIDLETIMQRKIDFTKKRMASF